jgi:hypothetical protein
MGEAMAMQLATDGGASTQVSASPPSDCHLHDAAQQTVAAGDAEQSSDTPCASCQICHALAVEPPFASLALLQLHHAQPVVLAWAFASAERTPSVEPPIA